MGMIRRAIVRAAPTCTLWRPLRPGDDWLVFWPAMVFIRVVNRLAGRVLLTSDFDTSPFLISSTELERARS